MKNVYEITFLNNFVNPINGHDKGILMNENT